MRLPTVRIIRDGRPVVINESDYDPKVHKLYKEGAAPEQKPSGNAPSAKSEPDLSGTATALIEEFNAAHPDDPIDPASIEGSGKGGKVTKPDAEAAIAAREEK